MGDVNLKDRRVGWVGTGRMGYALASRLLEAGCDVGVYNRTKAKAEPLAELGATVVDTPAELADRDVVFTMVAGPADFKEVVLGDRGILANPDATPRVIVDSTTISPEASAEVAAEAERRGCALLAAPSAGTRRSSRPACSPSSSPGPRPPTRRRCPTSSASARASRTWVRASARDSSRSATT